MKAKGKEDPHYSKREKGVHAKPTVSIDYKSLGESAVEDDKVTAIVIRDNSTKTTFAHFCTQKGSGDDWIVKQLLADIDHLGHIDLILKGDGEPALVQLMREVRRRRVQPTLLENHTAYDPQSNVAAEKAVQEYSGEVRALKIAL